MVVALAVLGPVVGGRRLRRGRTAPFLLGAVAIQWIVEGYRWQILPIHVVAIGLALGDVLWEERRVRGMLRFRRGVLGTIGLAVLLVLPIVLPVPELPTPTGPFAVGTTTFELVDPERPDPYPVPDPDAEEAPAEQPAHPPRRIMVQVWYPADVPDDARPVPWNPDWDVVGPAMSRRLGFPWFFLDHVADLPSHSYADAPILSGRLPVVVYSHGWTGFRSVALDQMESLASHGYVVIAPDHTYGAIATRFPDGEVVPLDPDALPDEDSVGADAFAEARELLIETFAGDLALVLDELESGVGGPFGTIADHVDLDHVGFLGHSMGGGAVIRFCLEDERCDAVVGFDPVVEGIPDRLVAMELQVPSMFWRSDSWRGTENDRRLRGLAERSPSTSYWAALLGSEHFDFVLTPVFSPYADRFGLKGPIPGDRVVRILDDYLVGFYDLELLGVGGAVLTGEPPPEVDFEILP